MKQLFDRNRDRLSREESQALWSRISEATRESSPGPGLLRPAWVAVAIVLIVAGSIWLHQRREAGEQMMHSRQEEVHDRVAKQLAQQYAVEEALGSKQATPIVSPDGHEVSKAADGASADVGDALAERDRADVGDGLIARSKPGMQSGRELPPSIASVLEPSMDAERSEPAPTEVRVDREVARQPETGGPGAGSEPPSRAPADPADRPVASLPVDEMTELITLRARGVVGITGPLSRLTVDSGEKRPPPIYPTTGGTTLPNDQVYDSMFFEHYGVNPFVPADEDALSTFAVDVDHGSYTLTRSYIERGHLPPKEAVRVEEFVNYFDQGYPDFTDTDFRIFLEGAPSPFGANYQLLRVGIKGRVIEDHDRKPANLTLVIDVSGSMAREDRLGLVKSSLRLMVDRLRRDDQVGIVIYGTRGRVLLEPAMLGSGADLAVGDLDDRDGWIRDRREQLLDAIDRLQPEGSTNTEEGLLLGYEMARRMYRPGAINRILLCSDGVANVGRTGPESILERVRSEADKGIQLTTIGFGMGNYNDVLMEQLANRGDGAYYYVDNLGEARRVLAENLTGTLQTIAKDAKVQVEFDPEHVLLWRLIGFENRHVADRDFRNDKVDAGEIGAGHSVIALYEVRLTSKGGKGRIATVRFRYASPEDESGHAPSVREIESTLEAGALHRSFKGASPRFRLSAAVAEFAEILRRSYWARDSRIADVLPVAKSAAARLRDDPAVQEFVSLVERSAGLDDRITPQERERMHGPQKPLPPGSVIGDPEGR